MTARFAYASILVLGFLAMTSKGQSPMSFAPPACQSLSSQLNLTDLAFDLDQDGDLDLLARNAGSVQLVPLRNDGPGVWTPLSPINLTQLPDSIRAGDLDGDGDPDLAMTRFDGNIGLLFQQTGAWTQVLFATGGVPGNGLQLVDWEGDGDLDILANRTHLHVNNGSGGFAPPQPIASFANPTLSHLESADLDGDGDSDYVSLTTDAQGRSMLRVHRKGPTGLTTQLVMSRTLAIQGLAIGDLDGDGLKDIAVLNTSVDHFPVNFQLRPYLQRSGFRFLPAPPRPIAMGPAPAVGIAVYLSHFSLQDANADGTADAWITRTSGSPFNGFATEISVLLGSTTGVLRPTTQSTFTNSSVPHLIGPIADLDQDGRADLVTVTTPPNPFTTTCVFANTTPTPAPAPSQVRILSGAHPRGWIGQSTVPTPLVLEVSNPVNGNPIAGAPVQIETLRGDSTSTIASHTTDPTGRVTIQLPVGNTPDQGFLILSGPAMIPIWTSHQVLDFQAHRNLTPPVGPPFVTLFFRYGGDLSLPILLAADLPLATPTPSPFGPIHTTLLSPGPSFAALDGLGVFGPPDPSIAATPDFFRLIPLTSPVPSGLTIVLQAYALDPTLAYPANILISPPRLLTF